MMASSDGSNVHDLIERQRALGREVREVMGQTTSKPLYGGGGGGTSDGMETRVARLEKVTEQLAKDVGDLRVDLAAIKENVRPVSTLVTDMAMLKERVSHLPTKDELGTKLRTYLTIAVSIIGVMIAAFGLGVKLLVG